MSNARKQITCPNGHIYTRSSDCPVCPVCEKEVRRNNFLDMIPAPARRALERENITSLEQLSAYSKKELLSLHGLGKSSLPKLETALIEAGMNFKEA